MNASCKVIAVILIGLFLLNSCNNNLNKNTKVNHVTKSEPSDLLAAVSKGDTIQIARILAARPDLEVRDKKGRTALMIATYDEDNKIAEMLIAAGADVNAQDEMLNSPFLYAGASGFVPILNMCLANGADFKVYNRYGGTALIPAAEKRHLEVVKILTAIPGYPIDHVNKLGWTALLEAIILGKTGEVQVAIVKVLVEAGADFTIADNDGITPLAHAKSRGLDKIVQILTQAGAVK